jgi:hypothetical protein
MPPKSITFDYTLPMEITLTYPLLRKTLREVQGQLLDRSINGGAKKLRMDTSTQVIHKCGMAACIGGWASLFLLGFDKTLDTGLEGAADDLFEVLVTLDDQYGNGKLFSLFHDYDRTVDYNEPNIAATAIGRYLRNLEPWPRGQMPRVMAYTRRAQKKISKRR